MFDFVDLVSIQLISEIEIGFKKETALNLIIKILQISDIFCISSESRHIVPSLYGNVCISVSRLNRNDDALKLSEQGIKYSKKYSDYSTMTHLRYIRALSLLKLGYVQQGEIEAIRCICNAITKDDLYELEIFHRVLTKDFKVDPMSIIMKYKNELLGIKKE